MNAALRIIPASDLDDSIRFQKIESPRLGHEISSRSQFTTQARYRRRGQGAGSHGGAHRRRQRRNYL